MRSITILAILLGLAMPAFAQRQFGLGQDLRLEGIVEPTKADEEKSLGTIKIRAGSVVRKFAVFHAQTAQTEGMSLFNRSELHPEQLLLYATPDVLNVFRMAAAGTRLRMMGRYQGDDFILAQITEVPADSAGTPAPTTPGSTAQPR